VRTGRNLRKKAFFEKKSGDGTTENKGDGGWWMRKTEDCNRGLSKFRVKSNQHVIPEAGFCFIRLTISLLLSLLVG